MRAVSRGNQPAPAGLGQKNKSGQTELDRLRAHLAVVPPPGEKPKPFTFTAYKADDVKRRLEALFFYKCAYCESFYGAQAPVDVEHFRPKGRVEGEPLHPGYWWLAAEWTNLLPSCLDCNRRRKQHVPTVSGKLEVLYEKMQTGKKDCFPVAGVRAMPEASDFNQERGLLLDPTRDEPEEHLRYWLGNDRAAGLAYPAPAPANAASAPVVPLVNADIGAVAQHAADQGVSVRGAVSIQVFGLNRVRLVQERARLIQQLRFLESIVVDVTEVKEQLESLHAAQRRKELGEAAKQLGTLQARVLDQMRNLASPSAPHSAVATAFMRDFKRRMAAVAGVSG